MEKILRDKMGLTEEEFLKQYRPGDYPRPSVTVDMLIFRETENGLELLLIRRGGHPYLGTMALPGGFIDPGENSDQAAVRELKEETGLDGVELKQLRFFSDPGRDPRGWTMSCAYTAMLKEDKQISAGDDAAAAGWYQVSQKLVRQEKERFQNGAEIRSYYELELEGEEDRLTALIEKKNVNRKNMIKEEYRIIRQEGIAFDHAKIISIGVEAVKKKG